MHFVRLLKEKTKITEPSPVPEIGISEDLFFRVKKQNQRLKAEIKMLYHLLVDKEARILRLSKFIKDELKKPEYDEDYITLEEDLNKIIQDEFYFDPRSNSRHSSEEEVTMNQANNTKPAENGSPCPNEENSNEEAKQITNSEPEVRESQETQEPEKEQSPIESSISTTEINQEQTAEKLEEKDKLNESPKSQNFDNETTNSQTASNESPRSRSRNEIKLDQLNFGQKKHKNKVLPVKPIEPETVTRLLFSFELELKEYSNPVFEATKQLFARPSLSVDEIHDEIERLADIAANQKYFQTIFPGETREKVANEIESYVFEVLHSRLWIVNEDLRGFGQQFSDRLNVLKSIVTFALLEIPEPLRNESLFTFAIKEFEKISAFKSPIWKLQAVQNAINHIINVYIQGMHREPASDELFPLLVYIVLNSEVEMLKYNVDYIYNYLRKCNLFGQLGFLVVNLKAVVQFLQELNGNSLVQGKLEMRKN